MPLDKNTRKIPENVVVLENPVNICGRVIQPSGKNWSKSFVFYMNPQKPLKVFFFHTPKDFERLS